jgi:tetratricopeptide (TPR) repeat protein
MNNLASAYRADGQLAKALPLYEETLAKKKAKLGPDHPDTLTSMNNLAYGYEAGGQLAKALPLYEDTLAKMKAKLGPDHPHTLTSMNNLGNAYRSDGQLAKALPLLEETLAKSKAKLGPDHPATLTSMNNLALAYQRAGQLPKALLLFEETLAKMKAKRGPDHPATLTSMNYLASGYLDFKEPTKAISLFNEMLAAKRKQLGGADPRFAEQLAGVALALLKHQQPTCAEPLLRECLDIRVKSQPEAWTTFNIKALLGASLLGQKNYKEAEPLLTEGYEGMKRREKTIPPQGKVRLIEAAERLVDLFEATGRKDEAKKWTAVVVSLEGRIIETVHNVEKELTLKGELDKATPGLIYRVRLQAGVTYVIDMVSPDPKALDPYLVLQDADRKTLAEDKDSGGNLNARITFRARADGIYRLRATSYGAGRGPFTLTVRPQRKEDPKK